MNYSQPLLSIIIPTHNRPQLLERAIISIKSQARSIIYEIIVISDVSDFNTDKVCSSFLDENDIYVRRSGRPGPSESRNIGILLSSGTYILFLDDDDAFNPQFFNDLDTSAALLQNNIIYTNFSIVKESRNPNNPRILSETAYDVSEAFDNGFFVKNQLPFSCYIFPAIILRGIKFDNYMRAYEDWEFLMAVFSRKMPVFIPILGAKIYQVDDESTDRRGSTPEAINFNAVLDYLYVYRRYPATSLDIKNKRSALLASVGINVDPNLL